MFRPLAAAALLTVSPAFADHHEADEARAVKLPPMQIVNFLAPCNKVEVAVSEFAAGRATSPEVKQFARTMVDDHKAFGEALRRAARRGGGERGEERREEMRERREERRDARDEVAEEIDEQREEIREERVDSLGDVVDEAGRDLREAGDAAAEEAGELAGEARRGARRAGEELREGRRALGRRMAGPRVDLRGEIADKMIGSLKDALGRQTGKQFDMAYLSHQRLTHQTMLDTLAVLKTHAGPEMMTALSDAETKIAGHLRTAQELSMRIDKQED